MQPVLFHIFSLPIHAYGLFFAVGFSIATLSMIELTRKQGMDTDTVIDFALWILIPAIVGARSYYVLLNGSYYMEHLLEIFMLNRGGLVFYGGLLGGFLGGAIFARKNGWSIIDMGDTVFAVLPIGQMFGRLGCFMNGCCFGSPTLLRFRVVFPIDSYACAYYQELQPVHPVQLYESLLLGFLFLFLIAVYEKKQFSGQIMCYYGLGYGWIRFATEFLRGDSERLWLSLTLAGWISLLLLGVSSAVLFFLKRRAH